MHEVERVDIEEQVDARGGQLEGQRRIAHARRRPHGQPEAAGDVGDARRCAVVEAPGQHGVDAMLGLGEGPQRVDAGRLLGDEDERERAPA